MTERAYTVAEIDRMRTAVEFRWLFGCSPSDPRPGCMVGRSYQEGEKAACVEEMLRTYMLAGIEPEELERPTVDPESD